MNLQKYTFPTKNGQLMSTQPFPNGNMLRTTAEYLITTDKFNLRLARGIEDCQIKEGTFSRYPDKPENTSVDDILVVGSSYPLVAAAVLEDARANWGCISVDGKPSFKQCIFRFQGMWQHLRIIADENVGLLGQAIWALSLYLAAKEPIEKQDNWVLSHLMVLTYEESGFKSFICEAAIKFWRGKKTKTTSQIMSEYLGPDCQDHPLIETWLPYN